MQQYRVNYPLLIGLVIGTFICSGAIYALHYFQNSRQAGWLLSEAEKAHDEKNYRDAVLYYQQYLSIHNEDKEARIKYANTYLDFTEQEDAAPEEIAAALQTLETMLRNPIMADVPETKNVRRRLVGLYGRDSVRNYTSALDHLNLLLEGDPNNAELQVLRASFLARSGNVDEAVKYSYKLIGYDPKKETFDVKKATAPHVAEVYTNLADLLHRKQNNPLLAERVANQMVDANPAAADAYVSRGRLRAAWRDVDGARADSQEAYRLKPEDSDVLLLVVDTAAQDNDFEKARSYIEKAKKLHPKEARLYQLAAALEMQQNKFDKASAELDAGAKAVGGAAATYLLFEKARLQIGQNDVKGAEQTIEDMQQAHKLQPEINDYFNATKLYAQGKWYPASEALSKVRPRMSGFRRDIATEIDYDLAFSYERLGRFEQAQYYYEQIVDQNPQNAPAVAGVQRMKMQRGLEVDKGNGDPLQKMVADELKKPKAQQDWSGINSKIEELSKIRKLDETTVKLVKAQVAMMHDDFDGADKLLAEANQLSPKNQQIWRFKVQLARANPKIGPEKALKSLQQVVEQFGDQPSLRLDKAEILIALNKDKQDKQPLKQDLASLLTGIDTWTVPQKVDLWSGMGRHYINLNMMDEARQYLNLAADNQPHELPLRLLLFNMALETGDADGMKAAQDKILQVVGDQNDSAWLYAEARRKLWLLRRGQLEREALGDIRSLVKHALDQRPDWGELHALLGEVELMSNNPALALKYYERAEELGRPTPTTVAQHIRLLVANGRYPAAGKLLDRIPEAARQTLLGPYYAEILFRTNQVDAAVEQARTATESDPTSAQNHYWYSQLLARSAQATNLADARRKEIMGQAIKSMQRAAELQPEFPEAWFALINYYLMQNNEDGAQKTMRNAQLVLSGDNLTLFLARSYEALHRWFDAETMYREIYETDPNDLQRVQQLAAFYLGPLYPRPDRKEKATPLINQLLRAGADGKIPASDSNLLWARRMAAKLLAGTGDYQNLLKAENLLASNSRDGSLLIEDKLSLAEILAPRPEPRSRKVAMGLLEEVSQVQTLNETAQITLADLYYAVDGDWSKYASEMDKALIRYPNSAKARESYVRKLLTRNDPRSLDRAATLVTDLRKIAPNYPATFELTVRLAEKLGKQQQVRDELRRRLPNFNDIKELDDGQKQTFAMFAELLVDLNDLDSAENIYRELAARDPKLVYEYAKFLGMHRKPEQCFEKLKEIYSVEKVPDILGVAMTVARERRDKGADKFDEDIQHWLDAGLRENPDSITLLVVQADLLDLQKRYDDAATIYRKLLTRTDLTGIRRAVVLNNLAYLVALAGKSAGTDDDPMQLVNEAAQILGPNSDILDTRAVVFISRKQYKEAIADLELSVTDGPTASKYFHKAEAHLRAKESRAAVEAWQKAEALGLNRDSLNRLEHDLYDKIKIEIDKIRRPSAVTKSEPVRKAG